MARCEDLNTGRPPCDARDCANNGHLHPDGGGNDYGYERVFCAAGGGAGAGRRRVYGNFDLRQHAAEAASLTIAITQQADIARYGGVVLAGKRIVGFQEKGQTGPGWINAGVYALQ
ncbi:MAG: hypothetical protein ACYCOR_19215, partial [Acidobacteriaceae bacterium]